MRMSTFKFITYFLVAMALSSCSNQEKNIPAEEEELLSNVETSKDNNSSSSIGVFFSELLQPISAIATDK